MFTWLNKYLNPSGYKDPEKNRLAAMLNIILLILLAASVFLIIDDWLTSNANNFGVMFFLGVVVVISLWLTQKGHLTLPRFLVPVVVLVIISYIIVVNNSGIHDIAMQSYPAVIILAGLLLGKRAPFIFALLCLGAIAIICYAEVNGLINSRLGFMADYSDLISITIILAVTAALTQILMNNFIDNLERTRRQETALIEANHQLQANNQLLEQQEKALRQSETQYRLMADHSTDMISRHTPEGVYLYASPACRGLLGYEPEELVGRSAYEFFHPDDLPAIRNSHTTILEQATAASVIFRILHKNGTYTWFETISTTVRDAQTGEIIEIIAASRDISQRKKAEEALRLSEERYRILVENLPGSAIILFDHGLRFVLVDGPEVERTGYSKAGMEGKTLVEALPAEFVQMVEPNMRAALAGQKFTAELPFGEAFYFYHYLPLKNSAGEIVYGLILAQNITERRRVEMALEREHTLLRTVIDNLPDYIYLKNTQHQCLVSNVANSRALGAATPEEVVGKTLFDFYPPEEAEQYNALDRQVIETGQPINLENSFEDLSINQRKWTWMTRIPFRARDGTILGVVGISRDITKRKQAEDETRRRNRELTLLNRIIAASVSGLSEEILETACRELTPAFDAARVNAVLFNNEKTKATVVAEFASEGQPSRLHTTLPITHNSIFQHLLIQRTPLLLDSQQNSLPPTPLSSNDASALLVLPLTRNNVIVGSLNLEATLPRQFSSAEINLAWSVADQISLALARVQLDKEQRQLSAAIEQTAESIIITDPGGTILYVNPAFERITGYSRSEVIGQNPRFLKSGKQDDAFFRDMWATISAGGVWRGRIINRRKDGSLYTEEETITPVRDEHGVIVNYVGVKRDVTREQQLEEQYRHAQKMEAVGRLTAGIAHDFNNLLTVINGFTALIKTELPAESSLQELLNKVIDAGQRAASLTRQLLAFSRKQITEPKVVYLNLLVTEMNKLLHRIIGEDITLETRLVHDLWPVKIDPTQIDQVILNLAVNARDAMPQGGKMTIETANVTLDHSYARQHAEVTPSDYVMLAISDNGIGMSDEIKQHLFEPFFTTKEVGKGTGLGLATVFGIVKQSNGHIWVYSELNYGTTFKIYLPRLTVLDHQPSQTALTRQLPRGREIILLVEDEPAVRDLASRVLRRQGYTVLEAANGKEALQLAQAHPNEIHLLLTDIIMPHMDGKTLAEAVIKLHPKTKVLFASGYTDKVITQLGMLNSETMFIPKPFSPTALSRKVREVLDS